MPSPDESSRSAADHFQLDSTAGVYRSRVGYSTEAVNYALRTAFHWRLGAVARPPLRILDAGVGTGQLTEAIRATGIPVQLVALDNSHSMLVEFRATHSDVPPVRANLSHLPFTDGSFDAVMFGTSLHWGDPERTPREVRRVLRPGGALISLYSAHEPDSDYHRLIHAELTSVLADNPITNDVNRGGSLHLGEGFHPNQPRQFANPTPMALDQLRQLLRSLAGLARAPQDVQARALAGAERFLAQPENAHQVVVPGMTVVHIAMAKPTPPTRKRPHGKKQGPT